MNLVVISWSFHYQSLMVKQQEQRYHPQKVWQYHGICCGNGWIMDTLLQRTQPRPIWHNGGIGSQLNLCHARIFIHWMSWRLSGYPALPCFFPRHSEFHRHDVGLHPTWKIWSSNFQDIRFAEDGDLGKTIWNTCQYIRLSGPLGHWWNILGIEVNDLGYGWSYLDLPLIQKIGTKNNWT